MISRCGTSDAWAGVSTETGVLSVPTFLSSVGRLLAAERTGSPVALVLLEIPSAEAAPAAGRALAAKLGFTARIAHVSCHHIAVATALPVATASVASLERRLETAVRGVLGRRAPVRTAHVLADIAGPHDVNQLLREVASRLPEPLRGPFPPLPSASTQAALEIPEPPAIAPIGAPPPSNRQLPTSEASASQERASSPDVKRRNRRAVGLRVALTGTDQALASLSNFAVGVAVARVAGIAALGAYSLAYVIWLVMADVHRSLVTDPMAIENDVNRREARTSIKIGLASELTLGVGLGLSVGVIGLSMVLAGQRAYGTAFLALAPWLPFLLVQDYWRWVGFMKARPGQALANDVLFDAVQALAFVLLLAVGVRSSVLALGAWGIGALAGSIFGLLQHRVAPTTRGGMRRLRQRWPVGSWLLGGSVTTWGAQQAYVVLTGIMLGPVGIGGLRAALSLVQGPSLVLLQAGGSVGLPEASKALSRRGWKGLNDVQRLVTLLSVLSVGVVGVVVLFFGRDLLSVLYGARFARYAVTADILVLSVFLGSISVGGVLALKATKLTGMLFRKSLFSLVASVIAVVVLVPLFGIEGAAAAAVARSFTSTATTLGLHRRFSRREAERLSQGDPPPIEGVDATPAQTT